MPTEIEARAAGGEESRSKTDVEVEALAASARLGAYLLGDALWGIEAGTELGDIQARLLQAAAEGGADAGVALFMEVGLKLSGTLLRLAEGHRLEGGELLAVQVQGSKSGYFFQRTEVRVVSTPSDEQLDFLAHLIEATQWMAEALRPGVESEFVRTESRGRLILPKAHGVGRLPLVEPAIEGNQRFTIYPGQVMILEPFVISTEFGTACASETVLVTEGGAEVLGTGPRTEPR